MTPQEIDVLFFIEHVDREMKGTLEVKKKLELSGLKVHVASIEFGLFQAWRLFSPKVVCYPYCKRKTYAMVELFTIRNPNVICVNLNYEQILSPATEWSKRPLDDFAKRELVHFAWGEHFKKYLISWGVDDENIHIVGKPEIQFLLELKEKESVNLKHKIAKEEQLCFEKKWVFIPFNDGGAFKTQRVMIAQEKKGGFDSRDLRSAVEISKESVDTFFRWIPDVAKKNNDIEFVYRPHPGVNIDNYKELLKKNDLNNVHNFHIIRSYTIKEWLCCSQVCISNWSTTMVDAQIIGLKTYTFKPSIITERHLSDYINRLKKIETIKDFHEAIKGDYSKENDDNYFDEYIDTSAPAVDRWEDVISHYVRSYNPTKNIRKTIYTYKAFLRCMRKVFSVEYHRFARKYHIKYRMSVGLLYDYFDII